MNGSRTSRAALKGLGFEPGDEYLETLIRALQKSSKFSEDENSVFANFTSEFPSLESLPRAPAYLGILAQMMRDLMEFEDQHDPGAEAYAILKDRMPTFAFFSDEDRNIEIPYDIRLLHHEAPANRRQPSKPLREIITMSELDLDGLIGAQAAGNTAGTTGLIAAANEKLRAVSEGIWTQSDACLYFKLDGPSLDLLLENRKGFEPTNRFSNLRSRSDGYRQFVALHVFTFLNDQKDVIIIIDEIEHHLHYDAQADLVQLLQKEPKIKKVVYTTHSAGALPEDLGNGVRLVKWDDADSKKSRVVNKFWKHDDGAGFRPLLFGMGAATFAFFPTRLALITEGPTELLLLPRLMREATESERLEFQVVHGLSNISPKGLPSLGADCDNVAFLVDNDQAGRELKKLLVKAGVSDDKVFSLKGVGQAITVEDLIDPAIWKMAVNRYIDQYGASRGVSERIGRFPTKGRIAALPKAIQKEKVSFAYNLLDAISEKSHRIDSFKIRTTWTGKAYPRHPKKIGHKF